MAVCISCPGNTVRKTEGASECEPCDVGKVANLDRTNCGEFGVNLTNHDNKATCIRLLCSIKHFLDLIDQ